VDLGDAACIIKDYVTQNGIDLIAMPTHGYGMFRRALLGSVTAKVLHDSKIPVWTSAHAPEQSHRAHPQPRRILACVDLKPSCRWTLEVAVQMARDTGAKVTAVHALAEGVVVPEMADNQLQEMLLEAARAELAAMQLGAGTDVEAVVQVETPARLIRAVALEKRADLIVIGRESERGFLGALRANANAIIREAPCPVLSL
jgi:nucleotide-binding universal stress UspA family protein